jgi:hypothetical protein
MRTLLEISKRRKELDRDLIWNREVNGNRAATIRAELKLLAEEEDRLLSSGAATLLMPGGRQIEVRR